MTEQLVIADALAKDYGDEVKFRALDDVSFEIGPGEFASIVGQSGSGKSTLLNLIGLLDTPTEGHILVGGEDAAGAGRRGRADLRNRYIGFVFQFHHLLPEFSVLENVLMPAMIAAGGRVGSDQRKRAEEVLGLLGLAGIEGKNANQLSGGQKQRVAIARALMNRPPLVLADEPTGNLDTANSAAVYKLFREINAELGTTFLIVTHDRGIAQQTDRILEIVDGLLVQDVRNAYAEAAVPLQAATEGRPAADGARAERGEPALHGGAGTAIAADGAEAASASDGAGSAWTPAPAPDHEAGDGEEVAGSDGEAPVSAGRDASGPRPSGPDSAG